jgi:signal transduction histidine kinase
MIVATPLKTILFICLTCLFTSGNIYAQEPLESREILILHSYHPGFPWTDEVMKGMQEGLESSDVSINFHVEYLDTKRHPDPEYFSYVLDAILHYKLENSFFDLVLVSDNEALNFVMEHRQNLFPSTPIVFCGVEKELPLLQNNEALITGVFERPEYHDLLKTIITLQPDTREVVVIGSDRDLTGRLESKMLKEAASDYIGKVKVSFWTDLSAEELTPKLQSLAQGQVVFINGPVIDRTGKLLSFTAKNKLVTSNSRVALYSPWDLCLGHGIIGGKLGSPKQQGYLAAKLAIDIFSGNPPKNGFILTPDNLQRVFDYDQLQKFGIPESRLPEGYRLINNPLHFVSLPPRIIWTIIISFIITFSIILYLINTILRRRKAENRLRESEQQYKHLSQQFQVILDGLPDGLTLISREMKVLWSNKGSEFHNFDQSPDFVPREDCCKLLYNRTALCDNCPAILAFESGRAEEAIITTPDNRILEAKAFPIYEENGISTNVIMLTSDITEKTRMGEEAIRNSRLASLGELAAGIAHEINNPNALILLNAELVQKSCAAAAPILQQHYQNNGDFPLGALNYSEMREELPHLFKEMLEGATRIKNIVHDLKDFSRNDTTDINDKVDMNEVVQAAIRLIGNTIKNSTHSFHAYYGKEMPVIRGNFQRIEQVVINLVMNACQSLSSKDSSVQISTHYDREKKSNCLRVRDEGIGIDPKILQHITDPFFTTKREQGGTGLGLSVTSRIVQDHSGTLDFHSPHGGGTTVTLSFPAIELEAGA